jgi:hypothetical protein
VTQVVFISSSKAVSAKKCHSDRLRDEALLHKAQSYKVSAKLISLTERFPIGKMILAAKSENKRIQQP